MLAQGNYAAAGEVIPTFTCASADQRLGWTELDLFGVETGAHAKSELLGGCCGAGIPIPPGDAIFRHMPTLVLPDGEGWLHEIKHDGHRLIAIVDGGGRLSLVSRNGYDRTEAFGAPFAPLAAAGHELVIDGEIAVPDDRGVTHLDFLDDAISRRSRWTRRGQTKTPPKRGKSQGDFSLRRLYREAAVTLPTKRLE